MRPSGASRAARAEIEAPGFAGDDLSRARVAVADATRHLLAAEVEAVARCVAGVRVRVRGRMAATRELVAWVAESPRMRDSQLV